MAMTERRISFISQKYSMQQANTSVLSNDDIQNTGSHATSEKRGWSDWEYFYSPLDGMLVHRRVTPSIIKFTGTHLYTRVEGDCESKVSCQRTHHNVPGQGSNPKCHVAGVKMLRVFFSLLHYVTIGQNYLNCQEFFINTF